jgi:dolichol-phosphate mannosyltransferase
MSSIIIIPTYNERENIERLITEILKLNTDFQILIVDDNSPDGTGEIIERISQQYNQIKVIQICFR